jgi:hypothetical protein
MMLLGEIDNPEGARRGDGPYGTLCSDCRASWCPADCFEPTHERNVLMWLVSFLRRGGTRW